MLDSGFYLRVQLWPTYPMPRSVHPWAKLTYPGAAVIIYGWSKRSIIRSLERYERTLDSEFRFNMWVGRIPLHSMEKMGRGYLVRREF